MVKKTLVTSVALGACLMASQAFGLSITDYGVIWQSDDLGFDGSFLSADIDITGSGSTMIVTVTNTTDVVGGDAAAGGIDDFDYPATIAFTGIGFDLDGYFITGGEAMGDTNDDGIVDFNVSNVWGWDTAPLDSGPFQNPVIMGSKSVDTVVGSTMASSVQYPYAENPALYDPSWGIDGPKDGVLPEGYTRKHYLSNTIELTLTLNSSLSPTGWDAFLASIDAGDVVIAFGSPEGAPIPEPLTMILFGTGLAGLAGSRLRRKKK